MNERVTVELDAETLKQAREAGVDLSVALRRGLRGMLPARLPTDEERERAAQQWYEENKEAVDASNAYVEKHGMWSDGLRMF